MYGFSTKFNGSYDEAIESVTQELAKEGFGILTEIDVKATLKKKLDVDKRPYIILGACNPTLANQAISAEPDIGLLLPCNVVVREEEDLSITVSFMDPEAVLKLVNHPDVQGLAAQVKEKLLRVRAALS
ncbi:DUF302 domain-containing protein [Vibrio sp. ZSDZ34]|jgi:uncharacterized protein (DUF302 family)|uniref:DUF302 domain-containing protein n=1 Tax=Vibrio gelatinilyticus TaxID=2893468 RepID=A0A9X1W8J8_9VIBR|nr:DUF302 domain-containing protein [Vibrio gelatinilyticus]MCJ2376352.1 DUF302 domain-containing protein [Vibrio gelatinilyticus]